MVVTDSKDAIRRMLCASNARTARSLRLRQTAALRPAHSESSRDDPSRTRSCCRGAPGPSIAGASVESAPKTTQVRTRVCDGDGQRSRCCKGAVGTNFGEDVELMEVSPCVSEAGRKGHPVGDVDAGVDAPSAIASVCSQASSLLRRGLEILIEQLRHQRPRRLGGADATLG